MNVHVIGGRVGPQQVIVKRGDIDAAREQLCHHRLDLGLGQHEIAHDENAIGYRLKTKPASERERRLNSHAIDGHLKVAARYAVAVDIALY